MGRFDGLAGLTEAVSHDPALGVSLRDLGQKAVTLTGQLKATCSPAARPVLAQLDKVLGEMNGIAKRM